ncbi:hypothetical protein T05_84 [Trichinella murrelli]|uniref:Uncharacterized protein n=1 Tax=Trichinella murrelli TaxID=144512 RepID=A0A0V0UH08_9BILA|nr:hypothetical protein T05_84 [Trichinella murrelli]
MVTQCKLTPLFFLTVDNEMVKGAAVPTVTTTTKLHLRITFTFL